MTHSPQVIEWDLGELTAESAAFTTPHTADMAINHAQIKLNVYDWNKLDAPLMETATDGKEDDPTEAPPAGIMLFKKCNNASDIGKVLDWIGDIQTQMGAIKPVVTDNTLDMDLFLAADSTYDTLRTFSEIPLSVYTVNGVIDVSAKPFDLIKDCAELITGRYFQLGAALRRNTAMEPHLTTTVLTSFKDYEDYLIVLAAQLETARDNQINLNVIQRLAHLRVAVAAFFTGGEYQNSTAKNSDTINKYTDENIYTGVGYSWPDALDATGNVSTIKVYDPAVATLSTNAYNFNVGGTEELNHTFKSYIQQNLIDGSVAAGQAVKHQIDSKELMKEMRRIMALRLSKTDSTPDFLGTVSLTEANKFILKFCLSVVTNGYSKKDSTTCFAMEFAVQNVEASMATALSVVGQTTGFKAIDTKDVQFNFPFRYKKQDPVIMYS